MVYYIPGDERCILWSILILMVIQLSTQVCKPGKYGSFCLNSCGKCLNSTCDSDTGYCPNGCEAGYYGTFCNTECGHCQTVGCDINTGICLSGCKDGYHGHSCNQVCESKKFGYRCSFSCHCKNGSCHNVHGACAVPGCEIGWKGTTCSQTCDTNEFGPDCTKTCHCKTGSCSENGTCDEDGCASGWKGQTCSEECQNGYYGEKCAFQCGNCRHLDICDKQTGICRRGCQDGYHGVTCDKICEEKWYGNNCSDMCGHCLNDIPCNRHNGSCSGGCKTGWEGDACTVQVRSEMMYYAIGGAIAGAVVVVIVIVIIIIVIIKRRQRKQFHVVNKKDTEYEPVDRESMYPRKYDAAASEGNAYYNTETQAMYYNPGLRKTSKDKSASSQENLYEYVAELNQGIALNELENVLKDMKKNNTFQQEYQLIQRILNETEFTTSAANEPNNKIKNRTTKTLPYHLSSVYEIKDATELETFASYQNSTDDKTRVILELIPNKPNSDYINASFIDGIDRPHAYIATQAPRKNTIDDFWRMIWQMNSVAIVMLTKLEENRKSVCEQYWPEIGDTFCLEELKVSMESERKYAFFIIRVINVFNTSTNETRRVKQFHFHDWSDVSLPEPTDLIMFHRKILTMEDKNSGPLVVHCSDGAARTGTFIALDALFTQGKNIGRINVSKFVQDMGKERMNIVQNIDHYVFLHDVLLEAFRREGLLPQKEQFMKTIKSTLERGGSIHRKKSIKEFEKLRSTLPLYGSHCYEVSRQTANRKKNRNSKVLAVDKYRACLKFQVSDRTDYINAVKVPTYTSSLGFLVTSFPLRDTVVDFWRMMYDYNSNTIVSLVEIDHIKESRLWWPEPGGTFTSEPFTVQRGERNVKDNISEECVTLSYQGSKDTKLIRVFEVTSWSRKHVLPPDLDILLKLVNELRDWLKSDGTVPITVMSLDGAVRCGLFCAIYNIIESIKIDEEVDIFEIIRQLKIRRPEFIQNSDQYSFCFDTAKYISPEDHDYIVVH